MKIKKLKGDNVDLKKTKKQKAKKINTAMGDHVNGLKYPLIYL